MTEILTDSPMWHGVECRCLCHRNKTYKHFKPCCCTHRYRSGCPQGCVANG